MGSRLHRIRFLFPAYFHFHWLLCFTVGAKLEGIGVRGAYVVVSGRSAILQTFINLLVKTEILCKNPVKEIKEIKEVAGRVLIAIAYSLEKYVDLTEFRTFLPSVLRMIEAETTSLQSGKQKVKK